MKKFLYCLAAILLITGCTNKEQEEKIQAFWQEQKMAFLAEHIMKSPMAAGPSLGSMNMPMDGNALNQIPLEQDLDNIAAEIAANASLAEQKPIPPDFTQTPPAQPQALNQQAPGKQVKPVNAYLIVSSSCPWSRKLRQENWPEKFRNKYQGQVNLIEYDVKTPEGKEAVNKLVRRYKITSIGTPSLLVGGALVRGYPLEEADAAVQKALARQNRKVARQSTQFMEIIMEDSAKAKVVNTKASESDRRAIQQALTAVEKSNQDFLTNVAAYFGENTKAQAFAVIAKTEKTLKEKAANSPNLKTYLAAQRALLGEQEKKLNQLIAQNANHVRSMRN